MTDVSDELQAEINKRLTLNLLIQGAAQHAFLTSHYLVRDELAALHPDLLRRYDQIAPATIAQYWLTESVFINGWPDKFWRRTKSPKHPFHKHPLLSRHGLDLMRAVKKKAFERCREKGVTRNPCFFSFQMIAIFLRTAYLERKHRTALIHLAKRSTHQVWGVPYDQLSGSLTMSVAFGRLTPPRNLRSALLRSSAAGYGGVLRGQGEFRVTGKAWLWPLLSHELVKGTVELICMHGLSGLSDETYDAVVKAADHLEYEPWMLQVGPEVWRRLLPLLPGDRTVAEMVMHIARLPARSLERLMLAVIEEPEWARELLDALGRDRHPMN